MKKEEVAAIVTYFQKNKVRFLQRLAFRRTKQSNDKSHKQVILYRRLAVVFLFDKKQPLSYTLWRTIPQLNVNEGK